MATNMVGYSGHGYSVFNAGAHCASGGVRVDFAVRGISWH